MTTNKQIHEGRTIEAWRNSAKQTASAPTANQTKEVKDPYWLALQPLLAKGLKMKQGTKRAMAAVEALSGSIAPTAEHAYKTAAANLQDQMNDARANDIVAVVSEARKKDATYASLIDLLGADPVPALQAEVDHLERIRQATQKGKLVARRELAQEAAADDKLAGELQAHWAKTVAYGDQIKDSTTLAAAKVMEHEAQEAVLLISEAEAQRAAVLGGTADIVKAVRSAIQEAGQLDVLDRPETFPTFETVRAAQMSKRKEAKAKGDTRTMRQARRDAEKATEPDEKFYMTDDQRKAKGIESGEEAAAIQEDEPDKVLADVSN